MTHPDIKPSPPSGMIKVTDDRGGTGSIIESLPSLSFTGNPSPVESRKTTDGLIHSSCGLLTVRRIE